MIGRRRFGFDLERFETIQVGDGLTLLRIAGRWRSRALERVPEPVIVVNGTRGEIRLDVLPDPGALPAFADADPPPWRAGFALPGEAPAGASYALRIADGTTYELPPPSPGSLRTAGGSASAEELDEQLAVAEREHARTEDALDVARRRLDEEIARRKAAEEDLELAGGAELEAIGADAVRRAEQIRALEARVMEVRTALDDGG